MACCVCPGAGSRLHCRKAGKAPIFTRVQYYPRGAQAVIDAVRWMKRERAAEDSGPVDRVGAADGRPRRPRARAKPFHFPPVKGFYEDPEQPESRYVWRWVTYQAPDLVVEFRGEASRGEPPDSLTAALRDPAPPGWAHARPSSLPASASHDESGAGAGNRGEPSRRPVRRFTTRSRSGSRARRSTSRGCSPARYPAAPSISYIPALAWIKTLELSALHRRRGAAHEGAGAGAAVALRREVAARRSHSADHGRGHDGVRGARAGGPGQRRGADGWRSRAPTPRSRRRTAASRSTARDGPTTCS